MEYSATLRQPVETVGPGPFGNRRIFAVTGGAFEGPQWRTQARSRRRGTPRPGAARSGGRRRPRREGPSSAARPRSEAINSGRRGTRSIQTPAKSSKSRTGSPAAKILRCRQTRSAGSSRPPAGSRHKLRRRAEGNVRRLLRVVGRGVGAGHFRALAALVAPKIVEGTLDHRPSPAFGSLQGIPRIGLAD